MEMRKERGKKKKEMRPRFFVKGKNQGTGPCGTLTRTMHSRLFLFTPSHPPVSFFIYLSMFFSFFFVLRLTLAAAVGSCDLERSQERQYTGKPCCRFASCSGENLATGCIVLHPWHMDDPERPTGAAIFIDPQRETKTKKRRRRRRRRRRSKRKEGRK